MFINERADNLADRLENVIRDGRNIKDENLVKNSTAKFEPKPSKNSFAADDARSEAEIELLKALRSIK